MAGGVDPGVVKSSFGLFGVHIDSVKEGQSLFVGLFLVVNTCNDWQYRNSASLNIQTKLFKIFLVLDLGKHAEGTWFLYWLLLFVFQAVSNFIVDVLLTLWNKLLN